MEDLGDIITYLAVLVAPYERLRAVGRPVGLIVERARVPHGLVRQLRHAYRVRRRACSRWGECALVSVVHVVLVVRAVKVLAVPAPAGSG
jgi:hypothetical protein